MKLGILLAGSSYGKKVGNNQFDRDWNLSKDNIKSNLIDCFPNDDVSVYLATYQHPSNSDLIEFYQPKKTLLLDYEGSHQRMTYARGLNELMDEDLDFIISSRFDIKFNNKVATYNFDFGKVNFLFRDTKPHWTNTKYVGDCLHGIPKKYLKLFIESILREHSYGAWFMHGLYNRMASVVGVSELHFLFDGNHNSHDNVFYELIGANIPEES
jgi:hypothetical protein